MFAATLAQAAWATRTRGESAGFAGREHSREGMETLSGFPSQDYETVVIAPPTREPGQSDVPTEELRQAPGAQGDAGKAIENLPGVARPALSGGELVVWGAAPEETRVLVDGMEIPMLYHLGGLRSVVNSGFVRGLSLVPGGYGAEYGRGLGGLVHVETRAPPIEPYQGEVDADVLDASFEAGAAMGHGGGVLLAGRYGYLDRILNGTLPADTRRLFPLPRYHDFQGKVVLPLRDDEKIELVFLTSADGSAIANGGTSPSALAEQDRNQSFSRLGLRYVRALTDGSGVSLMPFVGWDRTQLTQTSGLSIASQSVSSTVLGLRGHYVAPLSPSLTLLVGFDGLLTMANAQHSGPLTIPPREGDIVAFGQPMSGVASTDSWSASIGNLAPYASVEVTRGRWRMLSSLRLDGDAITTNRSAPATAVTPQVGTARLSWSPAPRFALAHQTGSWLTENLALGLYQQAPAPSDLSAVFGAPTLGVEHALHVVAGVEMATMRGLSVQPTLFYRYLWDLVARNPDASPPLAQALVQDGVGRAYGAQLLVRFAPGSAFSGWLAYTISRSERRHASESSYRLFDQDQTHMLTAVANARLGGFVFGTRFRTATGMPRTPVIGSYLDTTTGQYQPIFGQQNTIRLPVFYALDFRVERRFRLRAVNIVPYLEVLNLTNHANVEEYAYDEQFASRSNITGLPILAVAGVSVRF
jgi:hypothetical protein